jgi:hypothetical protein
VEKYDSNDNLVLSFGSYGDGDYQFKFYNPVTNTYAGNIFVNGNGDIFVSDYYNNRIQVFTPVSE